MMKSPSRWFGQVVDGVVVVWANAAGAASTRNAADKARMIIDVLPVRPRSAKRTTPVETRLDARLRRFRVPPQALALPTALAIPTALSIPAATLSLRGRAAEGLISSAKRLPIWRAPRVKSAPRSTRGEN